MNRILAFGPKNLLNTTKTKENDLPRRVSCFLLFALPVRRNLKINEVGSAKSKKNNTLRSLRALPALWNALSLSIPPG